jgi:hypothetical protein
VSIELLTKFVVRGLVGDEHLERNSQRRLGLVDWRPVLGPEKRVTGEKQKAEALIVMVLDGALQCTPVVEGTVVTVRYLEGMYNTVTTGRFQILYHMDR